MMTAAKLDRVSAAPFEKESVDELRELQLSRLQWTLNHTYANVQSFRDKCDAAEVHASDLPARHGTHRSPKPNSSTETECASPRTRTIVPALRAWSDRVVAWAAGSIWKTDGTALGTTQVTTNAISSTNGSNPNPIFELGDNLYFSATQTASPILYIADETNSITGPVSSIIPTANGVEFNNEYYYNIGNNFGDQLWKADYDVFDGINFTNLFTVENNINDLTVSGSNIFYVSFTAAEGVELWVSDGRS